MESKPVRVVCFVNQFFGQLGGEDKAGIGPQSMDGAVGAARAVQQALGEAGTVVATVACGDNYAAEQPERAVSELVALVAAAKPDLLVAGPAFLAGRYGVACGALCAAVQAQLKIPAVTGMHAENPGVELHRRQVYVVQTGAEATRMLDEVKRLVALGLKLARGEAIGAPAAEGYFPRGITRNVVAGASAADRATAMLLDKLAGRPFASEVPRPAFPQRPGAAPGQDAGGRHHRARHRRWPGAARQPRRHRGAERHALRRLQHRGQVGARGGAVRQPAPRLRHLVGEAGPAPPGAGGRGARARAERRHRQAARDRLLHRGRGHHAGPQRAHGARRSPNSYAPPGSTPSS